MGAVVIGPAHGTRYVVKAVSGGEATIEPEKGGPPERWTIEGLRRDGYKW